MRLVLIFLLKVIFFQTINAKTIEMLSPYTGESYEVSILSEEELNEFFQFVSTRSYIPFHIKYDGCFGRAYRMIVVGNRKNIELGKLVIDVINKDEEVIEVLSPDHQWKLRWYYHVAPFVFLEKDNGDLEMRILDPSLFNRPVSRFEFIDKLTKDNPKVQIEQVLIPKYVGSKTQRLDSVNLQKLDRMYMVMMSTITSSFETKGAYHEKQALYDSKRNKWYQGGWQVPAPREDE